MKLCVDNEWLCQKIASDPLGEVEAGRSIRRSADAVKAIEAAAETPEIAVLGRERSGTGGWNIST